MADPANGAAPHPTGDSAGQPSATTQQPAVTSRIGADLWPRVLSGVVMACVAVGLIVAGPQWFAGLALVIGVVLAWEWGRIVRGVDGDIVMVAHVCTVVAATVLAAMGQIALAMLATAIGLILVTLLSFGRHAVLSGLGVAFAVLPTVALICPPMNIFCPR